jgi:hypothetical protein
MDGVECACDSGRLWFVAAAVYLWMEWLVCICCMNCEHVVGAAEGMNVLQVRHDFCMQSLCRLSCVL